MSDEAEATMTDLIRSAVGKGEPEQPEPPTADEQVRAEVAAAAGLPDWADRLQGDSREALVADAVRLRGIVAPGRPWGSADAGRGEAIETVDVNALIRRAAGWI
jgi:hypothetical protein